MGENGEIELPGGSFSQLLFAPDDLDQTVIMYTSPAPPPLVFSANTPKMLCFGDVTPDITSLLNPSALTHSDTSSASSGGTTSITNNKRRYVSVQKPGDNGGKKDDEDMKKKIKPQVLPTKTSNFPVHAKGKREKLGERVTALQQLVSPFGKTDTASVLHEAMGYIRFLHEQVKVLSSPYLEAQLQPASSSSPSHQLSEKLVGQGKESSNSMKSRGLCLVPVECIIDLASSSGADFWSTTTISPISSSEPVFRNVTY